MEKFKYERTLYIGRFAPFHNGHAALLDQALALGSQVIVVLGSSFGARTPTKNPFTWQEREAMIRATLSPDDNRRVTFLPIRDYYNDKRWVAAVRAGVAKLSDSKSCALVGHFKDDSSYYLNRFPEWEQVSCPLAGNIDATALRKAYFGQPGLFRRMLGRVRSWFGRPSEDHMAGTLALLATRVPPAVVQFLDAFRHLPEYTRLVAENERVLAIKKRWRFSPYEPTFITVDALVQMQDKVLLIRRKGDIGDGLLAVPGGYLEPRELLLTSAIRELKEETDFGLYQPTLEDALVSVTVFDHPDRSLRGRTVTHLHHFDLKNRSLVPVRGNGKEGQPFWADRAELLAMEDQFLEDHFHMLDDRLGLTG